jgi:hypothetical protein
MSGPAGGDETVPEATTKRRARPAIIGRASFLVEASAPATLGLVCDRPAPPDMRQVSRYCTALTGMLATPRFSRVSPAF